MKFKLKNKKDQLKKYFFMILFFLNHMQKVVFCKNENI